MQGFVQPIVEISKEQTYQILTSLLCKQEDIQLMTILQKRLSMDTVYYADHTYCYTFTSTDDPQWQHVVLDMLGTQISH